VIDAYRNFDAEVLAYSPSLGIPSLRESIAAYHRRYGQPMEPRDVAVTVGGSEAIFFALSAVCDPGDEILVREPFYANYIAFAAMISAKVVPIPSSIDNGYALPSREEIARFITPRTKVILYISPENPTGIVYDRQEMDSLRELCERYGLYLISDEVYREFIYDDHVRFTSVLDLPGFEQHAILVDSISKRFSSCGAAHRLHRDVQPRRDGSRRQVRPGAVVPTHRRAARRGCRLSHGPVVLRPHQGGVPPAA